jgi:hypothetical protein
MTTYEHYEQQGFPTALAIQTAAIDEAQQTVRLEKMKQRDIEKRKAWAENLVDGLMNIKESK